MRKKLDVQKHISSFKKKYGKIQFCATRKDFSRMEIEIRSTLGDGHRKACGS